MVNKNLLLTVWGLWRSSKGDTSYSEFRKLVHSIRTREEQPQPWKESVIVSIYENGNKPDRNNCRGISVVPTTHKMLFNILLSRLTLKAEEVILVHQCCFRCTKTTTCQIFCTHHVLEKKV